MYPESPDKPTARRAAAALARARGAPIPLSFDGSDAAMQNLMKSGPQHFAALTYAFNEYAVENPGSFSADHVAAARAWLAKNPSPTGYASRYTLEKNTLATQAKEFAADYGNRLGKAVIGEGYDLNPATARKPNPESTIPADEGIPWGKIIIGAVVTGLIGAAIKQGAK